MRLADALVFLFVNTLDLVPRSLICFGELWYRSPGAYLSKLVGPIQNVSRAFATSEPVETCSGRDIAAVSTPQLHQQCL